MRRAWKVLIGAADRVAIAAGRQHDRARQQTKAAGVTVSGGRILELPGGDVQVVDQGPTVARRLAGAAPPGRADRAPALLRLLAALVGPDGPAAGQAPPGDPYRPARPRRLGEAGERLLDRGPGARSSRARSTKLGVQGAVVVGHSMGFDVATALADAVPASWSTGWWTSTRRPTTDDCCGLARSSPSSATRR